MTIADPHIAPRSRLRSGCVAALSVLSIVAAAQAAAQPRPERPWIRVLVEIDSPSLRESLRQQRTQAEQQLAQRLALLLGERHPFVAWRDGAAPVVTAAPMGTLVARVVDVGSAAAGRPVELAWALRGAGRDEALPVPAVSLYLPYESSSSRHNATLFADFAQQRLREKIQVQGFDDQARQHVVGRLPIARAVEALPVDRVVLLPLRWQDLRLGAGSRLEVQVTQTIGDGERVNRATLGEVRERRHGSAQQRGLVQAAISTLTEGSTDVPLQQQWNPRLPELLRGSAVECYLKDYRPAEAALGGAGLE